MGKTETLKVTKDSTIQAMTIQQEMAASIDKLEEQKKYLDGKIDALKEKLWKFRVGERVLDITTFDKYRITERIDDDKKYLYKADLIDGFDEVIAKGIYLTNDNLIEMPTTGNQFNLMHTRIHELQVKLRNLGYKELTLGV